MPFFYIEGHVPVNFRKKILKKQKVIKKIQKWSFFLHPLYFKYHPSFEEESPGSEFAQNHNPQHWNNQGPGYGFSFCRIRPVEKYSGPLPLINVTQQ